MVHNLIFLSESVSKERLSWIFHTVHTLETIPVDIYITGDAILDFFQVSSQNLIKKLLESSFISIYIDKSAWIMQGQPKIGILDSESSSIHFISDFWDQIVRFQDLVFVEKPSRVGFLQMHGPYQNRTSVHAVKIFESAIKHHISPNLYLYLDGVHLGHSNQRPSAFLNIGENLVALSKKALEDGLSSHIFACSRCATARGYVKNQKLSEDGENPIYIPYGSIEPYSVVNLNQILHQFTGNHPIISPTSILSFYNSPNESTSPPKLVILITHSPYGSEWAFGGLSVAIAAATNHGIDTEVVFLENGIYCVSGTHQIQEADRVFNIQEVIEATLDEDHLHYYVFRPSLEDRIHPTQLKFPQITQLDLQQLTDLLYRVNVGKESGSKMKRVFTF